MRRLILLAVLLADVNLTCQPSSGCADDDSCTEPSEETGETEDAGETGDAEPVLDLG